MTDRERELINRYVYEVTKRVPKEQRDEIELEMRELIGDILEELTLDQVFAKLGDPAVFARKYREDKNYVISPDYYDNYIWVMKIVLICVWTGMFISMVVQCVIDYRNVFYEIARFISGLMTGSVGAFGAVTLVFAFMERQKIKVELKKDKVWTSDMLNPIPDKKARISRGDCVASLVFIMIFAFILIFVPQFIGASFTDGNEVTRISLFNLDKWGMILPIFLVALMAAFVDEIIRLVAGCYCRTVMLSSVIANVIQVILAILVLKVFPIWNPNFVFELESNLSESLHWKNELINRWNAGLLSDIILGIIVFASAIEVGLTVYRTVRYGRDLGGR
ncbi:Uncharacterised protein [[Eubacterium] contortum]|uniref:Uncharacterized protein n=1 Tax=Faecalicatena contorta TaxID=39482 RepID=A0A174M888_9FIRM|nr:hypothetical protein [Faecalicatena contorta]CUP29959.1 Uncharacterised protein [[Eubacterium] contortum] [Faecalicatena contorta]